MNKWEDICDFTQRLKAPGGWIIKYKTSMIGSDDIPQPVAVSVAMCFVPCEPTANGSGVQSPAG